MVADISVIDADRRQLFADALRALNAEALPYVVAGAFAVGHYTGVWRDTKDMDLFLLRDDVSRAMHILGRQGFRYWVEADHWLAKSAKRDSMVDLIFGFGNWLTAIDQAWIDRAIPAEMLGVPVLVAPLEEVILSKAYVAHRERFDGADIMHLLRASGSQLDWDHLMRRFGDHWELLLVYLLLFRFVYPADRDIVPKRIITELLDRVADQTLHPAPTERVSRGVFLDRYQFVYDIENLGYHDPREECAIAQGWKRSDVAWDRRVARHMLESGQVRPS